MDLLVSVLGWFGEVVKGLGFGGTVTAIVGLALLGLALKFFDLADRVLDRVQRRWRRMSTWQKQAAVILVVFGFRETIWRAVPKTPGVAAIGLGVWAAWWLQGLVHARRYGMVSTSPRKAWAHHLDVSRSARRHTTALADGSGKKGGRARKPTLVANGQVVIVEPPHGESDVDTADRYESGSMNSALAHQFGWDAIRDVTAEPVGDGTVRVHALQDQAKDDFFDTSHNWPGMESS